MKINFESNGNTSDIDRKSEERPEEKKPEREPGTVLEKIRGFDPKVRTFVKALSVATMLAGGAEVSKRIGSVQPEEIAMVESAQDTFNDRKCKLRDLIETESYEDILYHADMFRDIPGGNEAVETALARALDVINKFETDFGSEFYYDLLHFYSYTDILVQSPSFDRYLANLERIQSKLQTEDLGVFRTVLTTEAIDNLEHLGSDSRSERMMRHILDMAESAGAHIQIIEHANRIMRTEFGREALLRAVEKIIGTPNERLTVREMPSHGAVDAFVRQPYGKALFYRFASESDSWWIDYLGRSTEAKSIPWMAEFVKQYADKVFESDPVLFLQEINVLKKYRPDLTGGTGIQICIEKLVASGNHHAILSHLDLFLGEPYAEQTVRRAAEADPYEAVIRISEALDGKGELMPTWIPEILEHSIRQLAESNPRQLVNIIDSHIILGEKSYINEIVHGLARTNPGALMQSSWLIESGRYRGLLREAMENAIDLDPEALLKLLGLRGEGLMIRESEKQSLFDRAIRNDPTGAEYNLRRLEKSMDPMVAILRKIWKKFENERSRRNRAVSMLDSIVRGRLTLEKADAILDNDERYFRELINISLRKGHLGGYLVDQSVSEMALVRVYEINSLHNERDDEARFASIRNSSPEELYLMLVHGEEEVFTSSFNGIFNQMLEKMKERDMDGNSLIRRVGEKRFRTFIKMCVSFNRFDEFLETMSETEKRSMIRHFVQGLDAEGDGMLEQAVAVAEAVNAIGNQELASIMRETIREEYARVSRNNAEGPKRLYGLLASLFGRRVGTNDIWYAEMAKRYALPDLERVRERELLSADGKNIQRYHFYDDEDGAASFEHFLGAYSGDRAWNVEDRKTYVIVRNHGGTVPVEIYANKPGEDSGEEEIQKLFKERKMSPAVFVHRGHSFHAHNSVAELDQESRIVAFGSCGGYRNITSILEKSPNAHIISTKGTGTMLVNDLYLKKLSEWISLGKEIQWRTFWSELEEECQDIPEFRDYIPPHKNFGVIFLKAYRSGRNSTAPLNEDR